MIDAIHKTNTTKRIVDDVLELIANGSLNRDDRLASIATLTERYEASRYSVLAALAELCERGVIVSRPRSGYYIAGETVAPSTPSRNALGAPFHAEPAVQGELERISSRHQDTKALRVYTHDALTAASQFWSQAVDWFASQNAQRNVDLVTGDAGHIRELFAEGAFDLIHTTPGMLSYLGTEHFAEVGSLELAGLQTDDLPAPVRQWAAQSGPVYGVPFALTAPLLFVNLELHDRLATELPETPLDLLEQAAALETQSPTDVWGFSTKSLMQLMATAGAVRWDEQGDCYYDRTTTHELLEAVRNIPLRSQTFYLPETWPSFANGKLMFYAGYTFCMQQLRNAQFRWAAIPLPRADFGSFYPSSLGVLAVRRDSPLMMDCLDLIQYLCSPAAQGLYMQSHGNLPVRLSACSDGQSLQGHHLDQQRIEHAVRHMRLRVNNAWAGERLEANVDQCGIRYANGQLSCAEAEARLAFLFAQKQPTGSYE